MTACRTKRTHMTSIDHRVWLELRKPAFCLLMSLALMGCDAQSAGGCDARAIDGTCRDWFAPSGELASRRSEAESTCSSLGATYQQTDFTCSSSGKVGACVLQSLVNGPRVFYYDSQWTQASARSECASLGGSFVE